MKLGWFAVVSSVLLSSCFSSVHLPGQVDKPCTLQARELTFAERGTAEVTASLESVVYGLQGCVSSECVMGALLTAPGVGVGMPAGAAIAPGSVVTQDNTVRWVEQQGRCRSATTREFVDGSVEQWRQSGGKVIKSGEAMQDWFAKQLRAQARASAEVSPR